MKHSKIFNLAVSVAIVEVACLVLLLGSIALSTPIQLSIVAVAITGFVVLASQVGNANHISQDDARLVFESYR